MKELSAGTDRAIDAGRSTVLLINPNTNEKLTALMVELAACVLAPHGLNVIGLTAAAGPPMIVDPVSLSASVQYVQSAVRQYLSGAEVRAVIIAAIGDPGWQELANELPVPVVGIGQASILAAAAEGRRFGMATSTPLFAESLTKLVATHGKSDFFTGVRLTPSDPLILAGNPDQQHLEFAGAVHESVADGAKAVIIAGGPLSETARRLALNSPAAIIQPLPSAATLVVDLLRFERGG